MQQQRKIHSLSILSLSVLMAVPAFSGFAWSQSAAKTTAPKTAGKPRVVYPDKTDLDFEGAKIEGELRNPGEFYFQRRPEEKFDSLVKRRKNFHREMLRDVVLSK